MKTQSWIVVVASMLACAILAFVGISGQVAKAADGSRLTNFTANWVAIQGTITNAVDIEPLAKSHIRAMKSDGSITNVVNMLIADGTLCQIRGHKWEFGCGMNGCLVEHGGPTRHCAVCGATQTQEIGPWK